MSSIYDRLLPRITKDVDDCWNVSGWNSGNGYAKISVNGKSRMAHRELYQENYDIILPRSIVLDHLCKNRKCCNPWHLDPVTNKENTTRGDAVLFKKIKY